MRTGGKPEHTLQRPKLKTGHWLPPGPGLVHYAPEGDDFEQWRGTFKCMCCKCRGVCGHGKTSGPGDLLQAMRQAAVPEWKNAAGLGRQKEVELGRRVRVRLSDGVLVGNVTKWQNSKVQVRGTQERSLQVITTMVDPQAVSYTHLTLPTILLV